MRDIVIRLLLVTIVLIIVGAIVCAEEKGTTSMGSDSALVAPSVHIPPGPEYADDRRRFQGIPGIERAPGGRLWVTWYSGGDGEGPLNYVLLATSGDDGRTWSIPPAAGLVIDPPGKVRAFDPCLWVDPDGRLWLFWAQSYSWYDGRAGVWAITAREPDAETPSWSAPRRLCDGIMMNKPLVLSTGEWLLPAAVWPFRPEKVLDPAHARDMGLESRSRVVCSMDGGTTWHVLGQADVPERRCDEHMLIERRDGTLWMLVRTSYGIGESISTDRGRTWGPGRPSTIAHIPAARFFIRRLLSGKLLLVKHNSPDRKTRSHLTAFLSADDGRSWGEGLLIDERKGVSYPDGVQSPDGVIYLVYDYSRTGAKQILMATFTEKDIAAGEFVSAHARSRIIVNQATGTRAEKPP